jgi:peptide alpha-N-acetyltransferase
MRDLVGFRETRLKILTLRPNSKVHWLSYALGVHVCGDAEGAIGVLDSYAGTIEEGSKEFSRGFETSELALYKNRILSETVEGDDELVGVKKALQHLEEIKDVIVDQTGWLQAKLSYQLELGMFDEAKSTCHHLFERGCTEDHRIHGAYMCALLKCDRETCSQVQRLRGTGTLATLCPLTDDERSILVAAYESFDASTDKNLAVCFPRSAAVKRIYLTLLVPSSEQFQTSIDKYCQKQLVKGVPSLGSDLSSLYLIEDNARPDKKHYVLATDPVDVKAHPIYQQLVKLVDSYINSLSSQSTFPNNTIEHPPSALLWAWYLRAILHGQAAEYADGITLINKCIDHTPTGVDFYELKANLLEAGGDIQQAAEVVDAGRDLDHQDRYINNQTTKTLLRAGREEDAKKIISMFAIHEGDPEQNLYDMQCTWFELELADSCRRKGQLGRSLRKYSKLTAEMNLETTCFVLTIIRTIRQSVSVIKHYEDYHEDQFDFHAYCVRKVTLRTYCEMLKFEDEIWGLPFYGHAAEEIIKTYLQIMDTPDQSNDDEEPDYSKMTPSERKKAKNIARKKKKAQEKTETNGSSMKAEELTKGADSGKKKGNKNHPVNQDPNGEELLALNPADEAKKFAAILVRHAPKKISSWALQYDVSVRRGKMLMALQVSTLRCFLINDGPIA